MYIVPMTTAQQTQNGYTLSYNGEFAAAAIAFAREGHADLAEMVSKPMSADTRSLVGIKCRERGMKRDR